MQAERRWGEIHPQSKTSSLSPSRSELGLISGAILVGGDHHAVWHTVHRAIMHNELYDIVASEVGVKGRRHAGETRQDRGAAGWLAGE